MKAYAQSLTDQKMKVAYVEPTTDICDVRKLQELLNNQHITHIHFADVADNWLQKRITETGKKYVIHKAAFPWSKKGQEIIWDCLFWRFMITKPFNPVV